MIRSFKKHHKQHHDQSDCGVVCLSTILSYYGSYFPIEELRKLSGTNKTGATMLGIIQCARKIGFEADGYEADIESLKESEAISILHVVKDNILQHYIVCFGFSQSKNAFVISDPAKKSVDYFYEKDLLDVWKTKALVLLKPTEKLPTNVKRPNKYKWVLQYLKQDSNIIVMAFLLGIIVSVLGLSSAIFSQKFIDQLLPSNDIKKVILGGVLLLFLMLISGFFAYIKQLFLIRQGRDFSIRIIHYFYTKLMYLPKLFFDTRKIGDLTARMNDTNRIQSTITSFISNIIVHFLMLIVASISIFSYIWKLGLLSLLWLPIVIIIVWYYHPKILFGQRDVMQTYAHNESNYIDSIKGIDVIKSSNAQSIFIPHTIRLFSNYRNKAYDLGKIGVQYQLVLQTFGAFFVVGLIIYSAYLVFTNEFTSGGVIALIQLTSMLMGSAIGIATLNIQLQEANIALNRMFEYTTIKEERTDNQNVQTIPIEEIDSITLNSISFGYAGRKSILNDISFTVEKGNCLGIVGEIGTGKSTLLNIIQRFYMPGNGNIVVNNTIDINSLDMDWWRSNVGVVHQDTHIFNGSVLQNIALDVQEETVNEIIGFCKTYVFSQFIDTLPQGYFTIIGEEGVNLSGGQKKIVALLRALYKQPKILLLDEVTASMDSNTKNSILQTLQKLKKNIIIILVSHDSDFISKSSDANFILG